MRRQTSLGLPTLHPGAHALQGPPTHTHSLIVAPTMATATGKQPRACFALPPAAMAAVESAVAAGLTACPAEPHSCGASAADCSRDEAPRCLQPLYACNQECVCSGPAVSRTVPLKHASSCKGDDACAADANAKPMPKEVSEPPELALRPHQLSELTNLLCRSISFVDRNGGEAFEVATWDFISGLRTALTDEGIAVDSLKLEGSTASHCLNKKSVPEYADLDCVFHLAPTTTRAQLEQIRGVLAKQLALNMPDGTTYAGDHVLFMLVQKQYISPPGDDDAWAVYSLKGSVQGTSIDLKFVQRLARPYQFSADSFSVVLDGSNVAAYFSHRLAVNRLIADGAQYAPHHDADSAGSSDSDNDTSESSGDEDSGVECGHCSGRCV